jgi:glutamate racemase
VLRALAAELPHERFLYLGDMARLPYGTKSRETIVRYALQAADELVRRGIKLLVVACNTASAVALAAMRERYADLPVLGVIEPGADAACAATQSQRIAVIATEGTVRDGAYRQAILRRLPQAEVEALACPLFVALAEEGWVTGEVAEAAARRYLAPLLREAKSAPDTLVLGCTHFPMLRDTIAAVIGTGITIVDSAATTARVTAVELHRLQLHRQNGPGEFRFLATDGAERFARVGSAFLGRAILREEIELLDL